MIDVSSIFRSNIIGTRMTIIMLSIYSIIISMLSIFFLYTRKKMRSHVHYNKSHKVLIQYKKSECIDETDVSAVPSTSKY